MMMSIISIVNIIIITNTVSNYLCLCARSQQGDICWPVAHGLAAQQFKDCYAGQPHRGRTGLC